MGLLVLAAGPGVADSNRPSVADLVREALALGDPLASWQQGFFDGTWAKRSMPPEHFRTALAWAAQDFPGSEPSGGLRLPHLVGTGYDPLALPRGDSCAPVATQFFLIAGASWDPPPSAIEAWHSTVGPPIIFDTCSGPLATSNPGLHAGPSLFTELAINLSMPLATCSHCAVANAQIWSDGTLGATHVNDFGYAIYRGPGFGSSIMGCYFSFCLEYGGVLGSGGIVELFDAEPTEALGFGISHVP
jgi:hypothetical protein